VPAAGAATTREGRQRAAQQTEQTVTMCVGGWGDGC